MQDQFDQRRDPRHDPRQGGGQEYAPPPRPQPVMRPAPGFENQKPTQWPDDTYAVAAPAAPVRTPLVQAAAEPEPVEGLVILSKPYRAHDIMIDRIVLRRPKAREIAKCGNPLKMVTSADGRVQDIEIKWDVVLRYIPLLATPALPPSTADEFDYFDLDACASVLAPFFVKWETNGT